jgi:hypothetical protein
MRTSVKGLNEVQRNISEKPETYCHLSLTCKQVADKVEEVASHAGTLIQWLVWLILW